MIGGIAKRHLFNEGDVEIALQRILCQGQYFIVVVALHDHGIQTDVFEILAPRCFYAGQDTLQPAGAGDLSEALGIQTVQADIDAIHTCFPQGLRVFVQLRAVGRQQQFLEPGQTPETLYQ
jgi:hypothetical protein